MSIWNEHGYALDVCYKLCRCWQVGWCLSSPSSVLILTNPFRVALLHHYHTLMTWRPAFLQLLALCFQAALLTLHGLIVFRFCQSRTIQISLSHRKTGAVCTLALTGVNLIALNRIVLHLCALSGWLALCNTACPCRVRQS